MDFREVGDGFVGLNGDTAYALEGDAAAEYRAGGLSRRRLLAAIGAGAAVAGVSAVVGPVAAAHASLTAGLQAITLSPTSGPKGTVVTVAGTGFFPSGSITSVTIGGVTVTPSSTVIDGTGNASFTFTVPPSVLVGSQTVSVTDNHNNTATKPFVVSTPSVTLSNGLIFTKNQGGNGTPPGFAFTVTASSGFFPSTTVTVSATGAYTVSPTSATTNASGQIVNPGGGFHAVYSNGAQSGTVTFTDSKGNTVTLNITSP